MCRRFCNRIGIHMYIPAKQGVLSLLRPQIHFWIKDIDTFLYGDPIPRTKPLGFIEVLKVKNATFKT